jgi:nicotinate-nucleotide adenylyltransferase
MKHLTGLFGGTFNPIHNGHLQAAEAVMAALPLDRILFIPAYIPPHKSSQEVAPVEHRLRLVEIACQGKERFQVSDIEARRPGPSYSIITLHRLKDIYPEDKFFFIVGSDAFLEIDTWKDYDQLFRECSFVVVSRPGFGLELLSKVLDRIKPERVIDLRIVGQLDRKKLLSGGLFILEARTPDISSTEIRRRVRTGLSIRGLVPEGVEAYIQNNNLYR